MAKYEPTFEGFLKATGHVEMWGDSGVEDTKFQELGWGATTNEGNYSQTTLIGNWSENSFDVKELVKPKTLPSQVSRENKL